MTLAIVERSCATDDRWRNYNTVGHTCALNVREWSRRPSAGWTARHRGWSLPRLCVCAGLWGMTVVRHHEAGIASKFEGARGVVRVVASAIEEGYNTTLARVLPTPAGGGRFAGAMMSANLPITLAYGRSCMPSVCVDCGVQRGDIRGTDQSHRLIGSIAGANG
ncbi:hypothetical protein BC628DRAFT_1357323 [Trametes gibbosa]|nr:hypothetical protein BC628DRAFT_1357323 [Trametes gibbosa]